MKPIEMHNTEDKTHKSLEKKHLAAISDKNIRAQDMFAAIAEHWPNHQFGKIVQSEDNPKDENASIGQVNQARSKKYILFWILRSFSNLP